MRKDSGSFPGDQNSVGSEIRETRSVSQCKTILVGAPRFELGTSCAQGSFKKSILLVRLALFYVMVHGFGPNLAVFGPKLDPSFGMNPYSETNSLGTLAVYLRLPYAYLSWATYAPFSVPIGTFVPIGAPSPVFMRVFALCNARFPMERLAMRSIDSR